MKDKVRSWIYHNGINLFIFTVLFSLSASSSDNTAKQDLKEHSKQISELTTLICELDNRANIAELKLKSLDTTVNDPYHLARRYKRSLVDYRDFARNERMFPNTKFEFQAYVDASKTNVSEALLAALIAYSQNETSPKEILKVNSIERKGNPFSRHYTGNAIDIHHASADDFLCWIEKQEGRDWLCQYQLRFYIEDNRLSKFLVPWQKRLGEFIFINPRATGPHIHLEYVGPKI